MVRLSRATLSRVAAEARPLAEPRATGVVHLGIGAFHRAHQAVYTELAVAATGDDRWGICGASQRSTAVASTCCARRTACTACAPGTTSA